MFREQFIREGQLLSGSGGREDGNGQRTVIGYEFSNRETGPIDFHVQGYAEMLWELSVCATCASYRLLTHQNSLRTIAGVHMQCIGLHPVKM